MHPQIPFSGARPETTAYKLSGLHVLHIDDRPHVQAAVRNVLIKSGMSDVKSVGNVELAFDNLRREPTDVILFGRSTCELGAEEFTYILRRSSIVPDPYIPVVKVPKRICATGLDRHPDNNVIDFFGLSGLPAAVSSKIGSLVKAPKTSNQTQCFAGPDPE